MFDNLMPTSCKIIHTSSPVVLLCGGPIKIKERSTDPEPEIRSLRHAILVQHPNYELFLPENIKSWHEDAVFKNLIDYEKELAAICSLVVIVIESAGSIAELGAFSQLDEVTNKLLIIKSLMFNQEKHKSSFINLGILRHLKERNDQSVKSFPWDITQPHKIEQNTIDDVIKGIDDSLKITKHTQLLNTKHKSHETTLVCALIEIFIALKQTEIIDYVNRFGFRLSKDQVKRKLFLLEKFQLIKEIEYDDAKFYCRTTNEYNKLRLAAKASKNLQHVEITLACMTFYEKNKDRHRLGAIKYFKEGISR